MLADSRYGSKRPVAACRALEKRTYRLSSGIRFLRVKRMLHQDRQGCVALGGIPLLAISSQAGASVCPRSSAERQTVALLGLDGYRPNIP
jgi:hypothetical protein